MGLRGPVSKKAIPAPQVSDLRIPSWMPLTDHQSRIFHELVNDAKDSRVGLANLDAYAFAVAAVALDSWIKDQHPQTRRDLIPLLGQLGGTPMARARLGIKRDEGQKSKMAALLKLPSKAS